MLKWNWKGLWREQYLVRRDAVCNLEYVEGDDDLAVCVNLNGENWEGNFLAELGDDDHADESDGEDTEPLPPKIASYSEAIDCIESVAQFLDIQGHAEDSLSLSSWVDRVASLKLSRMSHQTTIRDFFTK